MRKKRQRSTPDLPLDAAQANFRIVCNEVADQLAKHWPFRLQVAGIVITGLLVVGAAIGGIVGWSISATLRNQRAQFQQEAKRDIGAAKASIESEISEQFKKENVQKTVQTAAGKEAASLLAQSVQPSIKEFERKLDAGKQDLDSRFSKFKELIDNTEKSAANDVAALRVELTRLRKRNDLTALADKAISKGDVTAYRRLEQLSRSDDADEKDAVTSELYRVFQAYSVFSGVNRDYGTKLIVEKINPAKTKEEELEIDELLPLLKMDQPLGRMKVAQLIGSKVKKHSYKVAEAIAGALKRETHLDTFRALGQPFRTATGYEGAGKLDERELLVWWEENKDRLKKEDSDSQVVPTSKP